MGRNRRRDILGRQWVIRNTTAYAANDYFTQINCLLTIS
jgi:hypothetical protein